MIPLLKNPEAYRSLLSLVTCLVDKNNCLKWFRFGLWCLSHFQQYFSYIVAVSFIGGGNHWPVTSHRQTLSHTIVSVHLAMNGVRTHNFNGDRNSNCYYHMIMITTFPSFDLSYILYQYYYMIANILSYYFLCLLAFICRCNDFHAINFVLVDRSFWIYIKKKRSLAQNKENIWDNLTEFSSNTKVCPILVQFWCLLFTPLRSLVRYFHIW